jgi:hypothetical protein
MVVRLNRPIDSLADDAILLYCLGARAISVSDVEDQNDMSTWGKSTLLEDLDLQRIPGEPLKMLLRGTAKMSFYANAYRFSYLMRSNGSSIGFEANRNGTRDFPIIRILPLQTNIRARMEQISENVRFKPPQQPLEPIDIQNVQKWLEESLRISSANIDKYHYWELKEHVTISNSAEGLYAWYFDAVKTLIRTTVHRDTQGRWMSEPNVSENRPQKPNRINHKIFAETYLAMLNIIFPGMNLTFNKGATHVWSDDGGTHHIDIDTYYDTEWFSFDRQWIEHLSQALVDLQDKIDITPILKRNPETGIVERIDIENLIIALYQQHLKEKLSSSDITGDNNGTQARSEIRKEASAGHQATLFQTSFTRTISPSAIIWDMKLPTKQPKTFAATRFYPYYWSNDILDLKEDVVFVIEQKQIDQLSPELWKELLGLAMIHKTRLHLVVPDATRQQSYSTRVAQLKSMSLVHFDLPKITQDQKTRVVALASMLEDMQQFKQRTKAKLKNRINAYFGTDQPGDFAVALLYAIGDVVPEELSEKNGYYFDGTGRFSSRALAIIYAAYEIITTSA